MKNTQARQPWRKLTHYQDTPHKGIDREHDMAKQLRVNE